MATPNFFSFEYVLLLSRNNLKPHKSTPLFEASPIGTRVSLRCAERMRSTNGRGHFTC